MSTRLTEVPPDRTTDVSSKPLPKLVKSRLAQHRQGAANVVGDVLRKGQLRQGVDREAAADIIGLLNDPGLYQMLVRRRGWTPGRYHAWLAETMIRQLLPDEDRDGLVRSPSKGRRKRS
jgi:hypothetical protein